MWTKGLHTYSCFSSWLFPRGKHFCFHSVEPSEKTQADRLDRPFQACPDTIMCVFTPGSARNHYSPGAPKPMDVITCPLTSMWCNSGDFTIHTPRHALTWWKESEIKPQLRCNSSAHLSIFLPPLTLRYQPCVVLRCRVSGCISGKSAVDKHGSLLFSDDTRYHQGEPLHLFSGV